MDLAAQKKQIRQRVIAQRERLPLDLRAAHSASITEHLLQLPEYQRAGGVLGYMSFGAEFDSLAWVQRVLADGKRLLLPKVNRATAELDLYWVDDLAGQLAEGLWGIREPVAARCERLDRLNEVEFALLPGVAFTRRGERLGYGGGFYDKLLARFPHQPTLLAGAFALQLVDSLPQEATDRRVSWLVTEQETINCATWQC
ncbi:MAG: 5-formyltetrahydrofolate cyclo-ligase [Pseudomonadota bacterium]